MLTTLENLENLENSGICLILENSGKFGIYSGNFWKSDGMFQWRSHYRRVRLPQAVKSLQWLKKEGNTANTTRQGSWNQESQIGVWGSSSSSTNRQGNSSAEAQMTGLFAWCRLCCRPRTELMDSLTVRIAVSLGLSHCLLCCLEYVQCL